MAARDVRTCCFRPSNYFLKTGLVFFRLLLCLIEVRRSPFQSLADDNTCGKYCTYYYCRLFDFAYCTNRASKTESMSTASSQKRCTRRERNGIATSISLNMIVLWSLLSSSLTGAFMSTSLRHISFPLNAPQHQSITSKSLPTLMAQQGKFNKRGAGGPGGKPKKKKKGGKNKGEAKGNKKTKREQPNAKSKGPSKPPAHLPPWQIMSDKDAKENIQSEKMRREGIRQGEISSSVTSLDEKSGDVNASSSLIKVTDRQLFGWKRFKPERDIASMTFEGAFLGTKPPPLLGVPEVAFLGRSNVGKSSLLNQLIKRANDVTKLQTARVGKTPGATASVNLYSLKGKNKNKDKTLLAFADLPGFGYAKLSKEVKESVEMAAERYLGKRRELALGILLVDIRRIPSDDDRAVLAALYDMGVPLLVIATKVDKLSSNALSNQLEEIRVGLGLPEGQPFCVSSATGVGVKQLWTIIMDACEDKVDELRQVIESGGKEIALDDAEAYGNIQLDDEGNFMDDEEDVDEGYEWIQSFAYHDDDEKTSFGNDKQKQTPNKSRQISEESLRKMKENEEMQETQNEAQKVKNLKKKVRKMLSEGKI